MRAAPAGPRLGTQRTRPSTRSPFFSCVCARASSRSERFAREKSTSWRTSSGWAFPVSMRVPRKVGQGAATQRWPVSCTSQVRSPVSRRSAPPLLPSSSKTAPDRGFRSTRRGGDIPGLPPSFPVREGGEVGGIPGALRGVCVWGEGGAPEEARGVFVTGAGDGGVPGAVRGAFGRRAEAEPPGGARGGVGTGRGRVDARAACGCSGGGGVRVLGRAGVEAGGGAPGELLGIPGSEVRGGGVEPVRPPEGDGEGCGGSGGVRGFRADGGASRGIPGSRSASAGGGSSVMGAGRCAFPAPHPLRTPMITRE